MVLNLHHKTPIRLADGGSCIFYFLFFFVFFFPEDGEEFGAAGDV